MSRCFAEPPLIPRVRNNSVIRPDAVGGESNLSCARVCRQSAHSQALMIPFEMIVHDVFTYCAPKIALAQGNDPVEAFFFD
jgi:hypothetical protein